jgi:hypothetical protein
LVFILGILLSLWCRHGPQGLPKRVGEPALCADILKALTVTDGVRPQRSLGLQEPIEQRDAFLRNRSLQKHKSRHGMPRRAARERAYKWTGLGLQQPSRLEMQLPSVASTYFSGAAGNRRSGMRKSTPEEYIGKFIGSNNVSSQASSRRIQQCHDIVMI